MSVGLSISMFHRQVSAYLLFNYPCAPESHEIQQFTTQFFIVSDKKKYLFDLRNYIHKKLAGLGIKNIDHIKMDTFSDKENFFSYRRSKKEGDIDYGRCISVIIMT